MSDVQAALDQFKRINENSSALADPVAMLFAAQVAWMQAVTDALSAGSGPILATNIPLPDAADLKPGAVTFVPAAPEPAAPVADAAPSSTEPATIAPTTPSV